MYARSTHFLTLLTAILIFTTGCGEEDKLLSSQSIKKAALQQLVDSVLTAYKVKTPEYPAGIALKVSAGDEVCQLYLQPEGSPELSLQGFERVHIKKGSSRTISLDLSAEQLRDMTGKSMEQLSGQQYSILIGGAAPVSGKPALRTSFRIN